MPRKGHAMKYAYRCIVAAFAIATIAACSASPTEGMKFTAPAGWTGTPAVFGFQLWFNPANKSEFLMLGKLPNKIDISKYAFDSSQIKGQIKNASIDKSEDVMICGNQPAKMMSLHGTSSSSNQQEKMEMLVTNVGANSYIAMYGFPGAATANVDAEKAIKNVCNVK